MLMFILVKNVISINNKLTDQANGANKANDPFSAPDFRAYSDPYAAPAPAPAPAAAPVGNFCPNCGNDNDPNSMFCLNCGQKLK